jgi:hypothetical protein
MFINNSLTVLIANAKTWTWQFPVDCVLFTGNPAAAALEASLERKHNIIVNHFEAAGRTNINALMILTGTTNILVNFHM